MKRLFGLAVLVLAALTFTLASCQNETKDDKPTAYTVTIANDITNGTVTANKTSAVKGDTVKLTATPDNGWQLSSYSVTDENGNDITVTEGIFTMPASNVTVSATFTKTVATLNQEAADAVIEKINAIGTVAYTAESKTKIDEARSAYDKLTDAQKELVTNYGTLTTAESTYESLTPYTVTIASDIENGTVTATPTTAVAGTEITLTITPSDGYKISSVTVTDASNNAVTVTDIKFTMPKSNVTVTAIFIEKGAETKQKPDAVGDIVLSDGTAVAKENAGDLSNAQKAAAVAVIFYVGTGEAISGSNENILGEKTLGVGIHNTQYEIYSWAPDGTTGHRTLFGDSQNVQLAISKTAPVEGTLYYQYEYSNTTYYATGDFDGSDNWSKICEQDAEGTAAESVADNYPAFNWVNNYANTYSFMGVLANNWYLPSGVELRVMYDSKSTVNASLEAAGGTKIQDDYRYWSSSQSSYDCAWQVSFDDGYLVGGYSKFGIGSVCAIRAF